MAYDKNYKPREEKFSPDSSTRFEEKGADKTKPILPETGYTRSSNLDYKSFITPIMVKADPYDNGTIIGDPYSITNKPNTVIDVNYPGKQNTAGSSLVQLRSRLDSGNGLMHKYDSLLMALKINYLHLAMLSSEVNSHNNTQMERSFDEALSTLASTVMTRIDGLSYVYRDAGTTFPHRAGGNPLFGGAILYQTLLQNINSVVVGYNKMVASEKLVLDMSFNTTTTQVMELFNLTKKATFSGKIRALSDLIVGEYFDLDWARQTNVLQVGVSRKANSITDPILELNAVHRIPVIDLGIPASEGNDYVSVVKSGDFKATYDGTEYDLSGLVQILLDKMSINSILDWARSVVFEGSIITAKSYYNELEKVLTAISLAVAKFKAAFSGMRTVFDVLANTGMMYWKKNVTALVVSRPGTMLLPTRNRLIEDIFRAQVGSSNIVLDPDSKKWRYYTVWDKYDGISKFDLMSGGSFMAFSIKTPSMSGIGVNDATGLIPLLFVTTGKAYACNRIGHTAVINIGPVPDLSDLVVWPLAKLNPLNISLPIKVASTVLSTAPFDPIASSCLQDLIADVYGIGYIENIDDDTSESTYQFIVKDSFIAYVDIEIDSQAEEMLDYCRAYSPFRLQTPSSSRAIGFLLGGYKSTNV